MSVPHHSPRRRRVRAAIGCIAAVAAASTVVALNAATPVSAEANIDVQLLAFNDYHGHVTDDTAGDIDDQPAGGGEYLSAKLTELRATAPAGGTSLTVAAGDLIGGSPFFSGFFRDEPSVESLNAMGLDVSSVGNHEFDDGVEELLRMQNGGCNPAPNPVNECFFTDYDPDTAGDQQFAGAAFPWLAANVIDDNTMNPVLPPYWLAPVGGGQQIAFIGMTLEATPTLVAAAGIAGYSFEDEVATANAVAADIIANEGVQAIVVLLHEGGIPNPFEINGCSGISGPIVEIAENLSADIDAVITGHTHQPYTCSLNDPDGNLRPVTSAYQFGTVVTEINMKLDDTTGEVERSSITMMNHEVIQADLTADPAITSIIDKWTPLADAKGNAPAGEITGDITRGGDPTGSDRGVESSAGNMIADAQLAATTAGPWDADLALMNPGGVRSDLEYAQSDAEGDGVVTFAEAFTFQPFGNILFTLPMTGEQIINVLEEQCQPGGSSRPVLHLGVSEGFTYDLDLTQQDGVCMDVEISNVMLNGAALVPADTYRVTVNSFLADGGDNFGTFAEVDIADREVGPNDLDALIEYLSQPTAIDPPGIDRVNEIGMTLPSSIQSIEPARILETRTGPDDKTIDGEAEGDGLQPAGSTYELLVAGRGGVPDDAAAVALNLGAVLPEADGYLTVFPCEEDQPLASSVNYFTAGVFSNAVIAKVDTNGMVCIYTSAATHLIADVNGIVPVDGSPMPLVPARILETRTGPDDKTTDGEFEGDGPLAAMGTVELQVTGRGGVADDATGVVLNLGAVLPEADGYLTVYPCGETQPLASSVNYFAGDVVSNAVIAKIGDDGKVCIYTSQMTHLIADVNAMVPVNGAPNTIVPARLLETRSGPDDKTVDGDFEGIGALEAGNEIELVVTDRGGVAPDATTVMLNVTAVFPEADGYLTVYPCGAERPLASNVNYYAGEVIPNAVIAKVGEDGKVCIYSSATTDVIADVVADVSPPVPFRMSPA